MRTSFTTLQLSSVGKLPYIQHEGEYAEAERAIENITIDGIEKDKVRLELVGLREMLQKSNLAWQLVRGMCLGVGRKRVFEALVPYALYKRIGRVYKVSFNGLMDFMRTIHCWRYHGVSMQRLDEELIEYQLPDEVPYEAFKTAIDTMWQEDAQGERIIFQDVECCPVSIYNTPIHKLASVAEIVEEAIAISSYETMCQHIITSMIELPKSVQLLGVSEDTCYVLDTTGRNEQDIQTVFSDLVFPRRYFFRYIKFTGEVVKVEDSFIF